MLATMAQIKAEGARVVMVGYGEGVNSENMDQMASEPSSTCARGLGSGLGSRFRVAPVRPACASPTGQPLRSPRCAARVA